MDAPYLPRGNDTVHFFVMFAGDDQVSGPYPAVVVNVSSMLGPMPELDLLVELPTAYERRNAVPHGIGHREYWLPAG